jgi:hypothetical protein
MAFITRHFRSTTWAMPPRRAAKRRLVGAALVAVFRERRRASRCFAGVVVAAASLFGAEMPVVAATLPTLGVVVVGSGRVTSQPAGIACPGKCTATFVAGTTVVLTPVPKSGSTFLRWGGSCAGTAACTVTVSSLTVVGAQFVGGPSTPATKYVAVPGPYSGSNGQAGNGYGITFDVAPGGESMRNISVPVAGMSCTPSGGPSYDHLVILAVAIRSNGAFSAATTQNGVLDGSNARFTYTIEGRFQPATTTNSASAAGTWSEGIKFATGTTASCTSNDQSWTATLYREPPWQKSDIRPGNYSGSNGEAGNGYGITFSVAPGGTSILNVAVPIEGTSCTPSGGIQDHVTIGNVAVKPDGSFTSETSTTGVLNGVNAKFTYTFDGYFEGPTPPNGALTAAGIWREDMVFASGRTTMCTSDDQLWTATLK